MYTEKLLRGMSVLKLTAVRFSYFMVSSQWINGLFIQYKFYLNNNSICCQQCPYNVNIERKISLQVKHWCFPHNFERGFNKIKNGRDCVTINWYKEASCSEQNSWIDLLTYLRVGWCIACFAFADRWLMFIMLFERVLLQINFQPERL